MFTVVLFPSIESHALCFLPIYNFLEKEKDISVKFLLIDEVIPHSRYFTIPQEVMQYRIKLSQLNSFKEQIGKIDLLFVGNDAAPDVFRVIHTLRKSGTQVILLQDGWLDARNIRKPMYLNPNRFSPIKSIVHRVLVSKYSPYKFKVYGFIGQHADYFFVYSSVAKQNFIEAGVPSEKVFIVGSPRHATLKNIYKNNIINGVGTITKQKEVVVFFSRPSFNESDDKALITALNWISEKYKATDIIIKGHPSEKKSRYDSVSRVNKNISFFSGSFIELINQYRISMSFCFNSTIVLDMLLLNIPIIQLAPLHMIQKANYQHNLPIVKTQNELDSVISQYNITDNKHVASKYLADIEENFDSVEETVMHLKKLLANK